MTLTGLLQSMMMIIGKRINAAKAKGTCCDDAYRFLSALKINYYFVPVHRQQEKKIKEEEENERAYDDDDHQQ